MKWHTVRAGDGKATINIFDVIAGPQSADELIAQVGDARDLHVNINCEGGDSNRALKAYDFLRERGPQVSIHGRCSSAAVLIACAGTDVAIAGDAYVMVHKPCLHVVGNSDELHCQATLLAHVEERYREILSARTRQPASVINTWLGTDSYFSAAEALKFGLVDRIVEPDPVVSYSMPFPAAAGESKPDDSQQRLFLDFLKAFGELRVPDKAKFGRELGVFFVHQVKQHE